MAAAQREQEEQPVLERWAGKATARLKGVTAEQVWPLFLDDFCSFHKWLPTIDTCRQVEGIRGQPGLVRYCASTPEDSTGADVDGERKDALWCHEKLVAIDPVVRCLSYEVMENNMGIKSLVSTIKVLPTTAATIKSSGEVDDDEHGGEDQFGCQIQWSFLADPFEGLMTYDGFSAYINFALQGMADKMEKVLQSNY